jgi:hypothetical protein
MSMAYNTYDEVDKSIRKKSYRSKIKTSQDNIKIDI